MSLHTLFAPKSIALIGASTTPGSVGNDIAKNLIHSDFSGKVYPVNPKTDTLLGVRCYPTIADIPETVDVALIVVPASIVPQVLREAGEKMVRAAIIISAGFKETGEEGAKLEEEVRSIALEYKMTLLGPNCLGFIEPRLFLNASFASASPQAGNIAFFSQSGALMSALLDEAKESLGFSAFVSLGNKALLDEATLLKHFKNDAATEVIGFYTESLVDAPTLIETSHTLLHAKKSKPLIALKSGMTEAGTHASSSHTGALAGSAAAYRALFRQARILQAENFEELIELLKIMSQNPLPQGKRIAIVSNAGGLGVLATDAAVSSGLELASLSPSTQEKLRAVLPKAASVANPIDILGDALAERYREALHIVAEDEHVDLLLIILTPQTMTEPEKTGEVILNLRKKYPSLSLATVFAGHDLVTPGIRTLERGGIANFSFPESGARALGKLSQVGLWKKEKKSTPLPHFEDIEKEKVQTVFSKAREKKSLILGEREATAVLSAFRFPFLESHFVTSPEEALAAARKLGKLVVLKIVSPDILHKSDMRGVMLGVAPEEAGKAYTKLLDRVRVKAPTAELEGALVVEMSEAGGIEILLGLKKEPGLGTLLVFGLGGIYVETFQDIAMRFVPLSHEDIDEMIHAVKTYPLLAGERGQTGIDFEKLKEYMARLSQLALDFPEIEELDINPLLAFPEGKNFRVLDARLKLSE